MRRTIATLLFGVLATGCRGGKDGPDTDTVDTTQRDDDGDGWPNDQDCDPNDADVNPDADEICDGIDNDCDDAIDDEDRGVVGTTTWYADVDDDGYGDPSQSKDACEAPWSNASELGSDCDDENEDINPGEPEKCNGYDDDCDGDVDIDAVDGDTFYQDNDGDGYGNPDAEVVLCSIESGYSDESADCDDSNYDVNPAATELCFNDIDDNCDGETDDSCPLEICEDVSTDTTWEAVPFGYYVSCDTYVQGSGNPTLTIDPGTTVYFAPKVGLYVGVDAPGKIKVNGLADAVTFTSGVFFEDATKAQAAGDWTGLVLAEQSGATLQGLTLEYGGHDSQGGLQVLGVEAEISGGAYCENEGAGIMALDGASVAIEDALICDNVGYGFYADDDSGPGGSSSADFNNNTLTGNEGYPVSISALYVGELDDSCDYADHATDDAYIELRGGDLDKSVTVYAQEYPYYISKDMSVAGSGYPTMTVDDGAELLFGDEIGLTIGSSRSPGSLIVDGGGKGVIFSAYNTSDPWDGITVESAADEVTLSGLTLSYGGTNGFGGLYVKNGSAGVDVTLEGTTISHSSKDGLWVGPSAYPDISGCEFSNNAGDGVDIDDEGGLATTPAPSFLNNELTGNKGYPIRLPASALGALDDSSTFVGNTSDYVYVYGSTVSATADWQSLDAPFYVAGDISVQGSASPLVTIAAGAEFLMDLGTGFTVGVSSNGALATEGTSASPVTFTSKASSPKAGDWDGMTFGQYALDSACTLDGLAVLYGGDNGKGNVYINRSSPTFTDCHIAYSSNDGVYVIGSSGDVPTPAFEGCTIEESDGYGLYVNGSNAGLGDFASNTLTGNEYAMSLPAGYAGELDSASSYSGNANDYIVINYDTVRSSATWPAADVPFYVDVDLDVSGSSSPKLTLDAGLEMEFGPSGGITVGNGTTGSIKADGSSSKPIVFTTADSTPSSGDWTQISLKSKAAASSFKYIQVSYGTYGLYLDTASSITLSNSTLSNADAYDLYCTSRVGSLTLTSVTYGNQTGCL